MDETWLCVLEQGKNKILNDFATLFVSDPIRTQQRLAQISMTDPKVDLLVSMAIIIALKDSKASSDEA